MFILHGDNKFQQNWLFCLDIPLFSPANKGGKVLDSNEYLRVLITMAVVGVTIAAKRNAFALYFGKKTFGKWIQMCIVRLFLLALLTNAFTFSATYKPRLEKILPDMVLLTGVAELASEAEALSETDCIRNTILEKKRKGMMQNTKWSSIQQFDITNVPRQPVSSDFGDLDMPTEKIDEDPPLIDPNQSMRDAANESLTSSNDEESGKGESDDESNDDSDASSTVSKADSMGAKVENPASKKFRHASMSASLSTGTGRIKNLLDRWDEPANTTDKVRTGAW